MPRFDLLHSFKGASICSATQFSRQQAESLLDLAAVMKKLDEASEEEKEANESRIKKLLRVLEGKILVPLFFENSTRTFSSFCAAMQKLGGSVSYLPLEASSISKGESLEDTVRTVDCYADVLCLRHPSKEALARAVSVAAHPIMNCGNGVGEHPSQSLLDIFTIKQELGTLDGLSIALVGDLKHGRTVHSLARLLCNFSVKCLYLISPPPLPMPEDVLDFLRSKNVKFELAGSPTDAILGEVDVLYVTRIQKERFENPERDYDAIKGSYVIGKDAMQKAKAKMIVMHPLPRVDEISTEIDSDPRAAYFRQMKYGLHLRMALFVAAFGKTELFENI